jgi:glutamate 5-kinase
MYKRIIIKIGTSVITDKTGELDLKTLKNLVKETARLKREKKDVIIVTSGAVGTGRGIVTLKDNTGAIVKKQVFAAVGQIKLMTMYAEYFAREEIICAQVLATKEDFRDGEHYLHMKDCVENLLRNNIVPIVNENDVVAVAELVFTDNDELAGLLAEQLRADAVFFLTGVDGIMTGDWKMGKAEVIPEIRLKDSALFEKHITEEKSNFGRGGMRTKFEIAKRLARRGVATHIANGKKRGVLSGLVNGLPIGTKFLPK